MMERSNQWLVVAMMGLTFGVFWSCRPDNVPTEDVKEIEPVVEREKVVDFGEWTPRGDQRVVEIQRGGEGAPSAAASSSARKAETSPLESDALQSIFGRLPALDAADGDEVEFAIRASSMRPPRTGETMEGTFPPPTTPTKEIEDDPSPPTVLRFQPDGEVERPPQLSVTFSEPMVAVTSHADSIKDGVPVRIEPRVDGAWRWIGTRTLIFDPAEDGFPMATEFVATVPAGTESAANVAIAKEFSFRFTTRPVTISGITPSGGPHARQPVVVLGFDQRVDLEAILPFLELRSGRDSHAFHPATKEEIEADAAAQRVAETAAEGTWVAIRPAEALPAASTISVVLKKGAPSAEGPRVTDSDQERTFSTFGVFTVVEHMCGWGRGADCRPGTGWNIRFSNPLDGDQDVEEFISISPELRGPSISQSGSSLSIRGATTGRTTYQVTLKRGLRDRFGQHLDKETTLKFDVGEAYPQLTVPGAPLVVLDPHGPRRLPFYTVNFSSLDVEVHRVTPEDWSDFRSYLRSQDAKAPGRQVYSERVRVRGEDDRLTESYVDLSAALNGDGIGHAVVTIRARNVGLSSLWRSSRHLPVAKVWVQSTQLGVNAAADANRLIGWVTDLKDGTAVGGATLNVGGDDVQTNEQGLGVLPWSELEEPSAILVAARGEDTVFVPQNMGYHRSTSAIRWHRDANINSYLWMALDDREMYKPGETVRIKGVTRVLEAGVGGDVRLSDGPLEIRWVAHEARRNEIATGTITTNALGAFDFEFEIPDSANLGNSSVQLTVVNDAGFRNATHHHRYQIQEFRRPEFEVTANSDSGPHIVGGQAEAWVTAAYYAGGALSDADVTWRVTNRQGSYSPPGWRGYVFGGWTPWWSSDPSGSGAVETETYTGQTDAGGEHRIAMSFHPYQPAYPRSISASASVVDVNRQAWQSASNLLLHPAEVYVGLKPARYFFDRKEPIELEVIAADLDGGVAKGRPVVVTAHRLKWERRGGEWKESEVDEQVCRQTSSASPQTCAFPTTQGGRYRITAIVKDERGRPNQTQLHLWVSGGERPPQRNVELESVTLIPDKEDYAPGDTAKILIQSPFAPAEALITIRRQGIVSEQRITMPDGSHTLEVPINEGSVPNLFVQVDVVGAALRLGADGQPDDALLPRPAHAAGTIRVPISRHTRTLDVSVSPRRDALEPGGRAEIDVVVTDHQGKPAAGVEVALFAVDEAVLALSNYQLVDPLSIFYRIRSAGATDYRMRSYVQLMDPEIAQDEGDMNDSLEEAESAPRAAQSMMKRRSAPAAPAPAMEAPADDGPGAAIAVRENFSALAAFEPAVALGSDGKETIRFDLPDNLTRYRIMVVAVQSDKNFGSGEANLTARLPLMVRPSPPRFLNFGDQVELPVVIQNQTDEPLPVDVAIRGTNLEFTDGQGARLTVPGGDRVEVRFAARPTAAGTARFQVGAVSGAWADAAVQDFPVWTPATTEAFATYGSIVDGAAFQTVKMPDDVFEQFGGLEVTTSSTQLQALTDAFIYLVNYPYECAEQIASRVLAIAALRDVLSAFEAEGLPAADEIEAMMSKDLQRIAALQNHDGGWGFWRRGQASWPFTTAHVAHALYRAKAKGYDVSPDTLNRAARYLKDIEAKIPSFYSVRVRHALEAFAMQVLTVGGERDAAKARRLFNRADADDLTVEAMGWLLYTMGTDTDAAGERAELMRRLNNRVKETAATAQFADDYGEGGYLMLHGSRRADAVVLEALLEVDPQHDLVEKVVRGLLGHQKRGRWGNTQENVFVLLAMDRYFHVYEKAEPNFLARAWLGDAFVGEHRFKGRTTERHNVHIPMSYLATLDGAQTLALQKSGQGRLYYRMGMRYAPRDLQLEPADHGFHVERTYEGVDDPEDVVRRDDGVWEIRAGAVVKVTLTMAVPARRYHVALVDYLPAGLEALNPALAVTADLPAGGQPGATSGGGRYWWWHRPWYEHQQMRDERVEAFASLVWGGVHTYTYYGRATTPGQYVVPPTRAEEMYHPETFGRASSERVVIR